MYGAGGAGEDPGAREAGDASREASEDVADSADHEVAGDSEAHRKLWEGFMDKLPEDIKSLSEAEQRAYMRRLQADLQSRRAAGGSGKGPGSEGKRDAALDDLTTYREYVLASYTPRFPELFMMTDDCIDPALVTAVRRIEDADAKAAVAASSAEVEVGLCGTDESSGPAWEDALRERREAVHDVVREVHPHVFVLPVLSAAYCDKLKLEAEAFQAWCESSRLDVHRPNSMNNYGTILDDFGFEDALQQLMQRYLRPIAGVLFPDCGGGSLDSHHGFLVEYDAESPGHDRALGFHVDDSEVTLNMCLGDEFTGGDLFMRGRRCDAHVQTGVAPGEAFRWEHRRGVGLLHQGRHRHGAHPIESGRRVNLILWMRSSSYRSNAARTLGDSADAASCPSWCDWRPEA